LANAVIVEVSALVSAGRLTGEQAQPLINAAQCVYRRPVGV